MANRKGAFSTPSSGSASTRVVSTPKDAAVPRIRKARRRLSRAERAADVRRLIFDAAAQVIGEHGYANASVTKITELAGIAQGTFYLYFESRQSLFDELVTKVGRDIMTNMGKAVHGAKNFYEVEEKGYRGFFEYLRSHPALFRVLNDAEVAAPEAYRQYLDSMVERYITSLQRSVAEREITKYTNAELEALAHMLVAARTALYRRYVKSVKGTRRPMDLAVGAYMKLVRIGVK
jgi:AcrR family transcriptional regulator